MMPDLRDLLRERLVGRSDRALGALLHEIERVHGCRELVAGDELGERLVLAGEALGLRAALGLVEQVERGVRRLRHRADAALEHAARHLDRDRPLGEPLDLARLVLAVDLDRAGEHAVGPLQRVLEVVRGGEDRVDDAVVERLLGLQHPVLLERVRDDDLERVLDADEVRQQVRAAPAGDDAEEHLGQRDRGGRGIHRPVGRVQGDLEPAAEREPVHERERRHAEVGQLAEHVVAELRDQARVVLRADAARCRTGRRRRRGCTACR